MTTATTASHAQTDGARFDWDKVAPSLTSEFDRVMTEGDRFALRASNARRHRDARAAMSHAIDRYEKAVAKDSESAEAHYRLAHAIYSEHVAPIDHRRPDAEWTRKVVHHWTEFERLAPLDPRVPDVLFSKSLALTKRADQKSFRKAVAIYDRLLGLSSLQSLSPNTISIYLGNKAELHMMLGEMDEAIELYAQAIDHGGSSWLGYGLAVALDRDGQGVKARQVMQSNLFNDQRMQRLNQDGTFFVPPGEKHYYLALGYQVLGSIREAVHHYRAFIRSGAHPRFQPRAREHLRQLEPQLKNDNPRVPGWPERRYGPR